MIAFNSRCFSTALVLSFISAALAKDPPPIEKHFREFADRHCVSCHGPDVQRGSLRLDQLPLTFTEKDTAATWVKVFDRVTRGEMPPKSKDRPPEKETRTVILRVTR